ncbi:MAG: ribulose-phosphate 3-epimerase [Acutalibacteraceae bacterium]|nr:ribulose-phosphate 3-epimerase [Acutalibacteraceae bacterium]
MVQISPSILTADFCNLGQAVKELEKAKADMLHFDVMDGIFVPNISIGIPVCKSVFEHTSLPLDVHLMIQKPQLYIKQFAKYSERITIHYESDCDVADTLQMIKDEGVIAGLTIKPNTPAQAVFDYLDKVGMILVMSVEPGFGGQSYIQSATDKIKVIREEIDKRGLNVEIQVDGGINFETAPVAAQAGADILVAGSAIFNSDDYSKAINQLKEICK